MFINEARLIANIILNTLVENELCMPCFVYLMATKLDKLLKKNILLNTVSKIEVIIYEKYDPLLFPEPNKYEIIVPLNLLDISELNKPSETSLYYCIDYGESHGFGIHGEFRVYVYFYQFKPKQYKKIKSKKKIEFEN